eukprot:Gb_10032 [translate_table: standard]
MEPDTNCMPFRAPILNSSPVISDRASSTLDGTVGVTAGPTTSTGITVTTSRLCSSAYFSAACSASVFETGYAQPGGFWLVRKFTSVQHDSSMY